VFIIFIDVQNRVNGSRPRKWLTHLITVKVCKLA